MPTGGEHLPTPALRDTHVPMGVETHLWGHTWYKFARAWVHLLM